MRIVNSSVILAFDFVISEFSFSCSFRCFLSSLLFARNFKSCFLLAECLNTFVYPTDCRVGDEALIAIGQGCPLKHLNVSGCHEIGDAGIAAIARGCPQLAYLDVSVLQV